MLSFELVQGDKQCVSSWPSYTISADMIVVGGF